jgi:transcriptional regulator with XRE-family HTH domain
MGLTQGAVASWEAAGRQPKEDNKITLEEILGPLSMNKASKLRKVSISSGARVDKALNAPDSEVSSFGGWLRDQRTKAAISVPELAKSAKISTVAIYNIESGKSQNPQAATRDRLATALKQVVPPDVVTETEKEQAIMGLGSLTDFEPHSQPDWPQCSGVYVLYTPLTR